MKQDAYITGAGMTRFGKHLDRDIKSLAAEAVQEALDDAGITIDDLEAAYSGNAVAGVMTGQEMIRGQVVLGPLGMSGIPVFNIENACATASTAFHQAAAMVSAGVHDVVLVCAFEKLFDEDKQRSLAAYGGGIDVGAARAAAVARDVGDDAHGGGRSRSIFMDYYAESAKKYMAAHGVTPSEFASVSAKNSRHGSLNPKAQFQEALSVEDVLAAPMIAEPLTRPMCSPIGDGAAASIVMSRRGVERFGLTSQSVRVVASVVTSASNGGAAQQAIDAVYDDAGLGPADLDVIELHDASAPAELMAYSDLGLCLPDGAGPLIRSGATALGGRIPVNTSGGLLRKGHPIGATGLAQLVELYDQLNGRCGARQVAGARTGLAHNNGGNIGGDVAAACMTVLQTPETR